MQATAARTANPVEKWSQPRRDAIRRGWTEAEREERRLIARLRQRHLLSLLFAGQPAVAARVA